MPEIKSLDHYGRGITKINDKIVFVKNALPNEIVNISIINEKKKYFEAKVEEYVTKSNKRVEVKCPYYKYCGGCNIMHIMYSDQLVFKENKIKDIVSKYLDKDIKINKIVCSSSQFNYRNKVTFHVKEKIGFFKENTNELIRIDNCMIIDDKINKIISYLNKLDLKLISKIIVRSSLSSIMVIIETNNKKLNIDILKEIATSIYLKIDDEYILVFGKERICDNIGDYNFYISPDSFFQINTDVCEKLYMKVKEYVGINKTVFDLYCGIGTIGIFVNKGNKIIGIEQNKFAIDDANKNKELNNLENVSFICGDSGLELEKLTYKPDIIIIDPPRSGLNKKTIENILNFKPNEIIYISCDPMTLVRDLKILNSDYKINEITPFDMFPNTYHVETISYLKCK